MDEARKRLPIHAIRNKLIGEIQRNPVLILLGETGCGKTTQIPQYIFESQSTMKGQIAITQPRRVAAMTVAMRVSEEMHCEIGGLVGYCVRFEDCTSPDITKIKYMTDGMLVRESIIDPLLLRYTVVILDEVHERTLHTDILLGIVKNAQKERVAQNHKNLKIILM
jgi:HrpA-like RNA helicase